MVLNTGFRYLVACNGYPLSAVVAVLLHGLLLGFVLYWNASSDSSEFELVQPTVIKALFIDENPQLRERRRLERLQLQRRQQQEAEQRRQAEAEQRLAEEQQRQAGEEQRRQAERQRLAEAERQRRQLLEQQSREQEAEQQLLELAEEQRRQELAAEERRRQQEAERARRTEAAAAAAAATARTEFELVQSGVALIQQIVQQNWSRPPSARNGMRAVLRISMLPNGEVTEVVIRQSSGDPAFDRSAETAVYRAQPFRELGDMPTNIFNANFRSLSLIFEPEDLLN